MNNNVLNFQYRAILTVSLHESEQTYCTYELSNRNLGRLKLRRRRCIRSQQRTHAAPITPSSNYIPRTLILKVLHMFELVTEVKKHSYFREFSTQYFPYTIYITIRDGNPIFTKTNQRDKLKRNRSAETSRPVP